MGIFDELISRAGVPALVMAWAAVVWTQQQSQAQAIRDLWDIVNGKDGLSHKVSRIEGRLED